MLKKSRLGWTSVFTSVSDVESLINLDDFTDWGDVSPKEMGRVLGDLTVAIDELRKCECYHGDIDVDHVLVDKSDVSNMVIYLSFAYRVIFIRNVAAVSKYLNRIQIFAAVQLA